MLSKYTTTVRAFATARIVCHVFNSMVCFLGSLEVQEDSWPTTTEIVFSFAEVKTAKLVIILFHVSVSLPSGVICMIFPIVEDKLCKLKSKDISKSTGNANCPTKLSVEDRNVLSTFTSLSRLIIKSPFVILMLEIVTAELMLLPLLLPPLLLPLLPLLPPLLPLLLLPLPPLFNLLLEQGPFNGVSVFINLQ